jgi:putative transcriptional regulator
MKKSKQLTLAEIRSAKGLSQRELAKEINVGASTIGMYESGKRNPTLQRALEISKYFGIPVEQIRFDSRTII